MPSIDTGAGRESAEPARRPASPALAAATPIVFVADVARAAGFYCEFLGFAIDFLHGAPPFYGAVSRDAACLHLRHVGRPNFAELAAHEPALILASIAVDDVEVLFAEFTGAGVEVAQPLVRHPWGGTDFHVRDPDGNVLSFVEYSAGMEA